MKDKKKFSETKVGKFLKNEAPNLAGDLIGLVGDVTGVGILNTVGDAIKTTKELTPEQKVTALELLQFDLKEMEEVTKRWQSDMTSDSWLSKNVRPLTLVYLLVLLSVLVIGDSTGEVFVVGEEWIFLLKTLLLTVIVSYFGSRGVEKYKKIK